MKKKLIYYGGKFDPPTIAHLNIIRSICRNISFDELWIVPKWHTQYASAFHRFLMSMRLHQDVLRWMNSDPFVRMKKIFPSMHEFDRFDYTIDAVDSYEEVDEILISMESGYPVDSENPVVKMREKTHFKRDNPYNLDRREIVE